MSRIPLSEFARMAAVANRARRGARRAAPVHRTRRASLSALVASVSRVREPATSADVLTADERDELTLLAYSALRASASREGARVKAETLRSLGQRVAAMRTPVTKTPSRKATP